MDDAKVREAVDLIRGGLDGLQAAARINTPWTTLSAALVARRISVRQLKRQRNSENIRALVDKGCTTEAIAQRLNLPRRSVVNACMGLGLVPENDKTRRQRLRREQVLDLHLGGMSPVDIAERLAMHPGVVYRIIRDRESNIAAQVRSMYENDGLSTQSIAKRLRLGLDETRAYLRQSFPDNRERDPMPTEFKRGAAGDAARAAAG